MIDSQQFFFRSTIVSASSTDHLSREVIFTQIAHNSTSHSPLNRIHQPFIASAPALPTINSIAAQGKTDPGCFHFAKLAIAVTNWDVYHLRN